MAAGAEGVCLPLSGTRLPIQSAVDEAVRLGLPVYGWIAVDRGELLVSRVRRMVEAYPVMDGYIVVSVRLDLLDSARTELPGYRLLGAAASTPGEVQAEEGVFVVRDEGNLRDRFGVLVATELDSEDRRRLAEGFPGVEFVDGVGKERAAEMVPGREVMFGSVVTAEILARADAVKWIHTRSAGVNSLPFEELAARGITVTNSRVHGTPIAENFLALMLAFATGLHVLMPMQLRREWNPDGTDGVKFELEGQTLLIVGLGDLGATLARKAKGLGMRVVGARKRDLPGPEGVDEVIPLEGLTAALGRADHVALCLPLTRETTGFFREEHFRAMKGSAYLYNAGRGKSVDREALLQALRERWIAGAGLDTTDPEPLPPDDALWSLPNVLLTQHTSGSSPHLSRRVTDLFMENLRRYRSGEALLNVVDLKAGY